MQLWLQITRFCFPYLYRKYLVMDWIVMAPGRQCKFHALSAAHKLLILQMPLYRGGGWITALQKFHETEIALPEAFLDFKCSQIDD